MANRWRGEVELVVNGRSCSMRLSLGALAELEDRLEADGLVPLIERFESGAFRANDLIALLFAGLSDGGWSGTEEDLRKAHIEGGAVAAAQCAARLLKASFTLEP